MTLTEFLIAQSLDVLNIVWSKGSERLQTIVSDRIQKVCEFNLPEEWESLTEEQLKSLHRFEDEQQSWLLNQIFVDQESSGTSTETKYTTSNNRSAVLIFWFGVILTIASLSYIAAITWIPIPPNNIRFADTSLGFVLGTLLATVINFFFGSSMQKTDFRSYTDTTRRRTSPYTNLARHSTYSELTEECDDAYPSSSPLRRRYTSSTSSSSSYDTNSPQEGSVYIPPSPRRASRRRHDPVSPTPPRS